MRVHVRMRAMRIGAIAAAWNLRLANRATARILGPFLITRPVAPINVMALCFDPEGLRPAIANWDDLAPTLLARLHSELRQAPQNEALRALRLRIESFPGVPAAAARHSRAISRSTT